MSLATFIFTLAAAHSPSLAVHVEGPELDPAFRFAWVPPELAFDHHGGSFEVLSLEQVLALDPITGVASGTVTLVLETLVPNIGALGVLFDQGLVVDGASSPGRDVRITSRRVMPYRETVLAFTPRLAAGERIEVVFTFAGTLVCAASGRPICGLGGDLQHFLWGSALVRIEDLDAAPFFVSPLRDTHLSVPAGLDVVATADRVADEVSGGSRRLHLRTPRASGTPGLALVTGRLGRYPVPGLSRPVTLYTVQGDEEWAAEIRTWAETIFPFMEAMAGAPPRADEVALVKLPPSYPFRGTAGHGVVLLHHLYGGWGPFYFEQTWAHEISHLWFGSAVEMADLGFSHLLTEGLATLAEHDYMASRSPEIDRDWFLTLAHRLSQLRVRYFRPVPPVAVRDPRVLPTNAHEAWVWRYMKTAVTLEHLRLGLGEEAFAAGLARFVRDCTGRNCTVTDFRGALEAATGADLERFFAQWVFGSTFPEVAISFDQARDGAGWRVQVAVAELEDIELPLELWLEHGDRSVTRARARFTPEAPTVEIQVERPVLRVLPNPRHDGIVWSRSAVDADATMDGEVDGFDLAHCAFFFGSDANVKAVQDPASGLLAFEHHEIDPRCDADGDGVVNDEDLAAILTRFGTVKEVVR